MTATADAVGVGLAASFARPGGNVTGLTAVGGSIKNLGLLSELLPRATRFAVLLDPDNRYHAQTMVGFAQALLDATDGVVATGDDHFAALWPEAIRILSAL